MKALVDWTPRTANRESDRLANGDYTGFDPVRRVHTHPTYAGTFFLMLYGWTRVPTRRRRGARSQKQRKRKLEEKLGLADPW